MRKQNGLRGVNTKKQRLTGTVWDKIQATQPMNIGTKIPKSFEISVGSSKFWVHPNATKHMAEFSRIKTYSHGKPLSEQVLLKSFQSAIYKARAQGIKHNKIMNIGQWELIFSKNQVDKFTVIKHALYRP